MLNIGNFLHSETSAIGLTSLGLARKIENKTPAKSVTDSKKQTLKQLQQNMNVFSNLQLQTSNEETLNNLFNRNSMLNLNTGKLIG